MVTKLIKASNKETDVFIAPQILSEIVTEDMVSEELTKSYMAQFPLDNILESLPSYRKFIDFNAQKRNLSKTGLLCAHGSYDYDVGQWEYNITYEERKPVQSWINRNDGKYSLLFVNCCNTNHQEISSKKSAVLVPDANYSHAGRDSGSVHVELYVPKIGYVDHYCEKAQFEDLQKLLK
tara:strand:+ start:13284 stop:13820 length:537 start_codon:yes stop_codon:yes gene_type:complete